MTPVSGDDKPLDPAAARIVGRVRLMMVVSGLTTIVAIAAVVAAIGYRVFHREGSAPDLIATLPHGARVIATAVTEDRLAVTLDVGGAVEVRLFDLRSLKPAGRLRFATEP